MAKSAAPGDPTKFDLESLAADVVALAMKAGASDAEAVVREGDEFSVNVRMGQVETLKESGSRGLGLRVFLGKRSASASTSDLTAEGIRQLVDGALALAKVTEEDPFSGLPETANSARLPGDLHLYDEDVYSLSGPERIEWARRAEAAALAADPRITNSDGGSFRRGHRAQGAGQLARLCGRLPHQLCRRLGRAAGRWTRTAQCSATAGGPARGGLRTSNRPRPSAKKRRGGRCAGWARGAFPRSGFPSSLRRRWPAR